MLPHVLLIYLVASSATDILCRAQDVVPVSIPETFPSDGVIVYPNFFGISFELSFIDHYFGDNTSTIPRAMINYLSQIRSRTGNQPVRTRIGGNSGDISTYIPDQGSPMVQLTNPNANAHNQPVNYGPVMWKVLRQVADAVGGVEYLIGISLDDRKDVNPIIAGSAKHTLGDTLDSILVGNEPDLYTAHKQRPELKNYTVQDYIKEFSNVSEQLKDTPAGNILAERNLAGPTICCSWNLASLLEEGYLSAFSDVLKYITLQHYPQNNCFGGHAYELPYYLQHSNVVGLAAWQQHGIDIVRSDRSPSSPRLVMSEFNSASCGGVPGISDTFAVGSLWTVDYVLRLAAVGYSAAYIHTRESGISYNLVEPPSSGSPTDSWTTNPTFYSLLVVAEILQSENGAFVADLNVSGSLQNNASEAGYVVYDAANSSVTRVVLFNYADSIAHFELPRDFSTNTTQPPLVKYLAASSVTERWNISWGGETFQGSGDGKLIASPNGSDWHSPPNQELDCSNGCGVEIPGPAMAVVFMSYYDPDTAIDGGVRILASPGWITISLVGSGMLCLLQVV